MMRRRRARLIAVVVVVSAALVSIAHGGIGGGAIDIVPPMVNLVGTQGFAINGSAMVTSAPAGDTMQSASITGPDASAFTFVNNLSCTGQSCAFGIPGVSLDATLEIQCTPTGTVRTATLNVQGAGGANDFDTAMLSCSATGGGGLIDIVPMVVDLMGPQGLGQTTTVMVTSNPQPNAVDYAEITGIDATAFTINAGGCIGQACTYLPGLPTDATLSISCTPDSSPTPRTAQLLVRGPGNDTDTAILRCITTGAGGGVIDIVPTMIDIMGPQGVTASASFMITSNPQPNEMSAAQITGATGGMFRITTAGCNSDNCPFLAGSQPTDTTLTIECTPEGVIRQGQLLVTDPTNDMDSAVVRCIPTGGTPSITVNPSLYDAMTVAVGGQAGPFPVTIGNSSLTATLNAMTFLGDSINWSVDDCSTIPCSIPPMSSRVVNVTFHPMSPGPHNTVLTVNSNGGMGTVSLFGVGDGAQRLNVEVPSSFQLAFGPLARNQASTQMVTLRATGPSGYMVNLTNPGGVYTLSQQFLTMAPNGTAMFGVTCQSPTPGGPNPATITISAFPTPTVQNSTTIALTCTIQDTDVQVTPTMFAFNEVRVNAGERRLPFTIHNAGGNVMLDFVRITPARPGLSVTTIPAQLLTSANDLAGDVIVTPTQEVDLAGAFLEIGIAGEPTRQLPITGKVVTPAAVVTPSSLDLGTVCVGTQISGEVTMSNTGTAILRVEPPIMDQTSFSASATLGDLYPLDLAPNADATIKISPSTTAMGTIANALTWSANAPGSPFRVPVTMTYVTAGGAVSPSLVAFPALDVFGTSADRRITLQNCSEVELLLTINGVVASTGDASAWTVQPRTLQRTLAPKEIIEVLVRFTPKSAGEHHARLEIEFGGEDRSVLLEGFADGDLRDLTSFYACSCSGPGAPSRGWPIVIALALIWRRRRS